MKIKYPDTEEFTITMLSERVGLSVDYIENCIKSGLIKVELREDKKPKSWRSMHVDRRYFRLEEVLTFEKKLQIEDDKAISLINNHVKTVPPKDLLKPLVARATWDLQKETGKFPKYKQVLDRLRIMANSEDQAGAIIEKVSIDYGITIINKEKPISINTVKNWLTKYRQELPHSK